MKKTLYWLVESNGDLSVTVKELGDAKILIEGDIEGVSEEDLEEFQYTITPVMLTQSEYEALGEQD